MKIRVVFFLLACAGSPTYLSAQTSELQPANLLSYAYEGSSTLERGAQIARSAAPVAMKRPEGARTLASAVASPSNAVATPAETPAVQVAARKDAGSRKQADLPEYRHTVGIVTGSPQTTDFTIAYEIASVLSTRQETGQHGEIPLPVIPMVGNGGTRNIADVLTLPVADMAIVPVVMLNRARDSKELGDIRNKLVLIAPLFPEEFHLLASSDVHKLRDLAGQTVNLGGEGSAAAVLGRELLGRLGIKFTEVNVDLNAAIEGMRHGQIAATLLVSGKPVRSLETYSQAEGFHFVAIPFVPSLQQDYRPLILKHEDYPNLIDADESIDTICISSALIAYNWPAGSERSRLMRFFVQSLLARLAEFQTRSHHPKWQEVNL